MEFVNATIAPEVKNDSAAEHEKYKIPVLSKSKYVRELENHSAIYLWDERFAERGDLLECYEPTLSERISLNEDLAELNAEGFTYKQLLDAGATAENLKAYGITSGRSKN